MTATHWDEMFPEGTIWIKVKAMAQIRAVRAFPMVRPSHPSRLRGTNQVPA